jgi:hypothetical protein
MTTMIGIIAVAVVLIAGATLLVLGLCAASAARDEMESRLELPAEDELDHPQGPRRPEILRLAWAQTKSIARR